MSGGIYLHAGPEVSVASTKANTHMAVGFALLALARAACATSRSPTVRGSSRRSRRFPRRSARSSACADEIDEAAELLAEAPSLFFIGRVRGYPAAREGAQKFKEISYRHAEAYQTSELKHGPLALISPSSRRWPSSRTTSCWTATSARCTRSRPAAALVAITNPGVELGLPPRPVTHHVPKNEPELDPILLMIPPQLLAYHAALSLGLNIDRPRNLAKSVTVE